MLWKGRYPPNGQKVGKKGGEGGVPSKVPKSAIFRGVQRGEKGEKGGGGGGTLKNPYFWSKKGGGGGYLNNTLLADFCTNPFNMPLGGYCRK